ncbi:MAG: 3'-5' exonuclease [Prevotellaceae bacterium]|jgi:predicted PolB exonuclease-like 3'-5' exonuclease|nr:3'-5' exonuclease [Prevotellaceae bacterium]
MIKENVSNYLFLDIETVPEYSNYEDVPDRTKFLWDKKTVHQRKSDETAAEFYGRAGIWAEFGKIVCISCGFIDLSKNLRIKSFYGDDEKRLLLDFLEMLNKFFKSQMLPKLCAHNGKEFDFPFIARRTLINGLPLPPSLDVQGLKPWEIPFADTMELWKFGDYKHYCSLELLANIFGIPSPKDDIDGSMVAKVYYEDKDIKRIAHYCEKDVITLTRLFLKLTQNPPLSEIIIVK